jgi:predicted transcriptional regulator
MTVSRILDKKGFRIFTTREDASLKSIIRDLAEHHIGVLVVVNAANEIAGVWRR